MESTVICLECGKVFKRLPTHLKQTHQMTSKEYKSKYPGAQVVSEEEVARLVERNKSEKMRQAIIARNKTPEMRQMISERNRDPEFQKKCQAGCTEETRRAQSENMRKVSKQCWSDPEYYARRCKAMSDLMKSLNQDPEYVKLRSEIMKRTWSNPENAQKMVKAPKNHPYGVQSRYFSDKYQQEYYCRSQGELEFVLLCESLDEVISLTSGTVCPIKYYVECESHIYIPDFIVSVGDSVYVVEIKYEDDEITNHRDKVNGAINFCEDKGFTFCYVNRFSGIAKIKESGFDSVSVTQRI